MTSFLDIFMLFSGIVITPLICILLVITIQVLLTYIKLCYLNIRYGLNKIPEPKLSLFQRYTIGHGQLKLLFKLPRDECAKKLVEWKRKYNGIFIIRGLMGEPVIHVMTPGGISHASSKAHTNKFIKPQIMRNTLQTFVGDASLLLTEGQTHSRLRRIIAPAFHYHSLISISSVFLGHAETLAQSLLDDGKKNNHCPDVLEHIHNRAFALIVDACFGNRVISPDVMNQLRKDYYSCIREPLDFTIRRWILQRFFNFLPFQWFGYKEEIKQQINKKISALLRAASTIYTSNNSGNINDKLRKVPNLLSVITDAQENNKLSHSETVSAIMTFLSAGQITTTFGIVWLFYNLAENPEWQDKLREELKLNNWDKKNENALQQLDELPILDRVVKESLRKDSPATSTSRQTSTAECIDGINVPPGVVIRFPIHAHQRDPDVWGPDAHEFKPDRWLDEKLNDMSTFYTVFWHGTRGCIGKRFALLELKAFTAVVLQKIQLSLDPKDPLPFVSGVFANPLGLKLYCRPLEAA